MQDTNLLDLQCVDALSNRSELKSASKPPSLPKQFIDYIDSKLEPIKQQVVHTQLETEKRMQGIEEKMDLLLTMVSYLHSPCSLSATSLRPKVQSRSGLQESIRSALHSLSRFEAPSQVNAVVCTKLLRTDHANLKTRVLKNLVTEPS